MLFLTATFGFDLFRMQKHYLFQIFSSWISKHCSNLNKMRACHFLTFQEIIILWMSYCAWFVSKLNVENAPNKAYDSSYFWLHTWRVGSPPSVLYHFTPVQPLYLSFIVQFCVAFLKKYWILCTITYEVKWNKKSKQKRWKEKLLVLLQLGFLLFPLHLYIYAPYHGL